MRQGVAALDIASEGWMKPVCGGQKNQAIPVAKYNSTLGILVRD